MDLLQIGDFVCDMHDGLKLPKGWVKKSFTVFPYENGDEFIVNHIRKIRPEFYYVNKSLVVFSESCDYTGGIILAYSYDGRRLGFVEVEIN